MRGPQARLRHARSGVRRSGLGIAVRSGLCIGVFMIAIYLHGGAEDGALGRAPAADAAQQGAGGSALPPQGPASRRLQSDGLYPTDAFTPEQRKSGAIVLHIMGLMYMFVALAVVCDEYFVPALDVIVEVLGITEDVAGATFMAAGGSAPELFTSVIGVFIAKSDIGFGTIVGSAVFNVLFVIAMCAIFSRELLHLTWWPLLRDSSYYAASLIALVAFFFDEEINLLEAGLLLLMYGGYGVLMRFNRPLKRRVFGWLGKPIPVEDVAEGDVEELRKHPSAAEAPELSLRYSQLSFRAGVLHLMLNHVDARGMGPRKDSESRFRRAVELVILQRREAQGQGESSSRAANHFRSALAKHAGVAPAPSEAEEGAEDTEEWKRVSGPHSKYRPTEQGTGVCRGQSEQAVANPPTEGKQSSSELVAAQTADPEPTGTESGTQQAESRTPRGEGASEGAEAVAGTGADPNSGGGGGEEQADEDVDEGIGYMWPKTLGHRVVFVLLAPLTYALYYTIPDVSRPKLRKWFPLSFLMSILWIGAFSYLMVWWATLVGEVFNIPDAVMGLTLLAAGTSIPDLLTSVIVSRQGFGDMAVSSSIGSNIFDVLIGLPLPWFLSILIAGENITVASSSLVSSALVLCVMLVLVIGVIATNKWCLSPRLAAWMFVLYIVFVAQSLLTEYGVFAYPF